jgi:hypothetical protein
MILYCVESIPLEVTASTSGLGSSLNTWTASLKEAKKTAWGLYELALSKSMPRLVRVVQCKVSGKQPIIELLNVASGAIEMQVDGARVILSLDTSEPSKSTDKVIEGMAKDA